MSTMGFVLVVSMVICPTDSLDETKCKSHKLAIVNREVNFTEQKCRAFVNSLDQLLRKKRESISDYRCEAMDAVIEN